jgi:membrane associated rhomboid family serine protease
LVGLLIFGKVGFGTLQSASIGGLLSGACGGLLYGLITGWTLQTKLVRRSSQTVEPVIASIEPDLDADPDTEDSQ